MTDPASGPPPASTGDTVRAGVARWGPTALWAIADQAFFATSNFALNVLLARWLPAAEYGAFAVAYSVFLLLAMVHSALLIEPLLVFGAGRHEQVFATYLRRVVRGHALTAGLAAAGVLVAAAGVLVAAGPGPFPSALLALGIAAPFVLYQWLARRACYVQGRVREAAFAGAGYMTLVLGGAYALFTTGALSVASALALMGAASLVTGAWLMRRLGLHLRGPALDARATAREHWHYGRWVLATGGLSWLLSNLLLLLLPLVASFSAAGELRAGLNLLMPLMHLGGALATVGLPALVRASRAGTGTAATRLVLAGAAAFGVVYGVALVGLGNVAAGLLYAESFRFDTVFLALLGVYGVATSTSFVLDTALRSLERSNDVFRAHAVSTAAHLVIGLPLLLAFDTNGVAAALAGTFLVHNLVLAARLRAVRHQTVRGGGA